MKYLYKRYYITEERIAKIEFNDELKKYVQDTLLTTKRIRQSIINFIDNTFIEFCFTENKEMIKKLRNNWLLNDEEIQRIIRYIVDDYIDEKGNHKAIGFYDYEVAEKFSKED